ncbi:uncharacterized protein LOC123543136 [Mercenaria mercenaria]|uniref:uncharacterized protein LOC123543136 n=1 Tax=Mercenaria mercenaria TaxID=6596 RepID=UPI00234EDAF3|nr:uncharacterized protein LOC123543136 [Mercenaria mercenaria]
MTILYFLFLFSSTVSGFLVQNGSTGISSSQTSADRTIQNLLNLIVNEQNSRLQLQNIVTTLSNKIDQLENAQDQMQKNSDVKLNQTENEMVKKLKEMSARLVQMEQFNTEVSKQLDKEKNNREYLEEMYTVLEKRVNNLTIECGTSTTQSEKRNIETTLNNLTSLFTINRNNLTDVNMKLINLASLYKNDFNAMEVKLQNLTNSSSYMQDKLAAVETKLNNLTFGENEIHIRLNNISNENVALKLLFRNLTKQTETRSNVTNYEMVTLQATLTQNQHELAVINSTLSGMIKSVTINGLIKYHEAVGFSVNNPDKSSGSPLKYQTLTYNTGHGYNMSTGVFTC